MIISSRRSFLKTSGALAAAACVGGERRRILKARFMSWLRPDTRKWRRPATLTRLRPISGMR
jgi:anaerobic selenocysteine-containing dehydrogenase